MRTIIQVSLLLALLIGSGAAEQPDQAAIDLAAAIRTETIDGDLDAAIQQYATIAETSDPAIAAEALLRMGGAYEKLGKPEALEIYQRVLREYPGQRDVAQQAQARLVAAEANAREDREDTLRTELLWEQAHPVGHISPDGRLVTYLDFQDTPGDLAIHNLATGDGEHRHLTHTANWCEPGCAGNSRISPDGEQVVYDWGRELRLLPLDGDRTEPRTVWSPAEGSHASVQDWFPSGDRVAAVVTDSSQNQQIVTVSILDGVDGRVQQVRSINWSQSPQVRVSPDSRYLAYSRSASRDVPEKDIFLVAVDGSSESVVVQHDANDELVAWSKDGTHLLFNSDRSGQPGLWAQRVHDAAPAGEPQLLIANIDVGAGMGITRDGTLHYAVRVTRRRLKIAELDLETGEVLSPPVNVTDRFVGGNNAGVFSPDGETLAYVSDRQGWRQSAIVLQSLKTGEERDLPHALQRIGPLALRWRSDSDRLLVAGQDDRGRFGFFDVNVATGQTRPLPEMSGMWGPMFTPDGTQILHRNPSKNRDSVYAYRVADGSVHALPGVFGGVPRFRLSPNGRWIATVAASRTEIRLHPAAGGDGDVLSITDERERFGRWTTWTPDGSALIVPKREPEAGENMPELQRVREQLNRLWVVPVDGSDSVATDLVYDPANAGFVPFEIHPDGTRIVYSEGRYFYQFWALHNLGLDESDSPSR